MSTASLVWGMLFGAIGAGYLIYGWRQKMMMATISGLLLSFFTYFIDSAWLIVLLGAALMALPFKFRF